MCLENWDFNRMTGQDARTSCGLLQCSASIQKQLWYFALYSHTTEGSCFKHKKWFEWVLLFFGLICVNCQVIRMQGFCFQRQSVPALRAIQLILFPLNRAAYCAIKNHFSDSNRLRVGYDLEVSCIGHHSHTQFCTFPWQRSAQLRNNVHSQEFSSRKVIWPETNISKKFGGETEQQPSWSTTCISVDRPSWLTKMAGQYSQQWRLIPLTQRRC